MALEVNMKKILLGIVIIICICVITIFGVNYMSASETAKVSDVSANQAATTVIQASGGESEIEIGSGNGTGGSTVTIPVSVNTVPEKGIGSFNFNIKYDTGILEAVEVKPGAALVSDADFDYTINNETGTVTFLFACSNNGKDSVTKPGVITNLSFKIKENAKKGVAPIASDTSGAFGDTAFNRINAVFKEGGIKVD